MKNTWLSVWILAMLGMIRTFKICQADGVIIMETTRKVVILSDGF